MNNSETQQQCNKLRAELALQKEHASAFADSAILSLRDIRTLEDLNTQKEQAIESLQHSLTQALNEADELRGEVIVANASIAELETQNTLANEALTAIAKQLGLESFTSDEVMIAIESLLLNPKWEQLAKEWKQSSENSKILSEEIKQENEILLDNLNRSQSDRLSELTNIMRMVQALEDTPQDKIDGAIYLIKRVLYDSICKLDPSQSWDA